MGNTLKAAVIVGIVALFLYIYTFNGNITGYFRIGSILPHSSLLEQEDVLTYQDAGYDGQMFLSLAMDPFLLDSSTISSLDNPRYRYRRIFYPLLGYITGFGNPWMIPYSLVLINYLSIIFTVFLAGIYLKRYGNLGLITLFALCIPGIWISFSLSTPDLLCGLALSAGIYSYYKDKPILTSLALMFSCLTRETMLIAWFAFFLTSILDKKRLVTYNLIWACIPSIIWNIYVVLRIPEKGSTTGLDLFGFPLYGLFEKIRLLITDGISLLNIYDGYSFSLLILITFFLLIRNKRDKNRLIFIVTMSYALLMSISDIKILRYFDGYNRIFLNIYILLLFSKPSFMKNSLLTLSGLSSLGYILAFSLKP
jgi:hypothetical protein